MKIVFAGFRHEHILLLYGDAKRHGDFEIAGACEEDAAARAAAEKMGVAFRWETYRELLADESVDAVVLGGIYGDRGRMAVMALEAGKHVISDKPLCTTLADLDRIEEAAARKKLAVSCMFTMRFEKKINAVKNLLDSGELGEIQNVYIGGQHPLRCGKRPDWYYDRASHGGVINDLGIHGVDLLYYFGLVPDRVLAAREWNAYADKEPDFSDCAQFMLSAENGAGVIADVSYSVPDGVEFALPYYWQFFIWGTKGVISFSLNEKKSEYFVKGDKLSRELREDAPQTDYLSDFLKAVRGERAILPVGDVLRSTRKTLAIQAEAGK